MRGVLVRRISTEVAPVHGCCAGGAANAIQPPAALLLGIFLSNPDGGEALHREPFLKQRSRDVSYKVAPRQGDAPAEYQRPAEKRLKQLHEVTGIYLLRSVTGSILDQYYRYLTFIYI